MKNKMYSYDKNYCRRKIYDQNVIVHCHRYNARMISTIEDTTQIDGKKIVLDSAEYSFGNILKTAMTGVSSKSEKIKIASDTYSYLGLGKLVLDSIDSGNVQAATSHIVSGWLATFGNVTRPVCSITAGYIRALAYLLNGTPVEVTETKCIGLGHEQCEFLISEKKGKPLEENVTGFTFPKADVTGIKPIESNVNSEHIHNTLFDMEFVGNDEGLIPMFNSYLASIPEDFYNLVSIKYVEELDKIHLRHFAQKRLIYAAEVCGMNTFYGIINSQEWEALVKPMLRDTKDMLVGMAAVATGLGWGKFFLEKVEDQNHMSFVTEYSYESVGYRKFRNLPAKDSTCLMFRGVTAGIVELTYSSGTLQEKFGTYDAIEPTCCATSSDGSLCKLVAVSIK